MSADLVLISFLVVLMAAALRMLYVVRLSMLRAQELRQALLHHAQIWQLREIIGPLRTLLPGDEAFGAQFKAFEDLLAKMVGYERMRLDRPFDERVRFFDAITRTEHKPTVVPDPVDPNQFVVAKLGG